MGLFIKKKREVKEDKKATSNYSQFLETHPTCPRCGGHHTRNEVRVWRGQRSNWYCLDCGGQW